MQIHTINLVTQHCDNCGRTHQHIILKTEPRTFIVWCAACGHHSVRAAIPGLLGLEIGDRRWR